MLPGRLWLGVVALDKDLSMSQTEQTVCKQMTDIKLWLLYSNTWNIEKSSGSFKNVIYKIYLQIVYIFNIYVKGEFDIK